MPVICALAGDKLIDHLRKWLEPEKLLTERTAWERGQDAAIAAALLDLFHLLPNQASKFLETTVRA
jgi:transformation/transcription domain-associated protein